MLDEHLIFIPGFPVSYEQNSVKNIHLNLDHSRRCSNQNKVEPLTMDWELFFT